MSTTLLPAGREPSAGRLNLEASVQVTRNRALRAARSQVTLADMADIRVRLGYDYTPGVGWHAPADPRLSHLQAPPYHGVQCACPSCENDWRDRLGRVRV